MNNKFYPLLLENPNAIYIESAHTDVDWTQIKTLSFTYYNTIMYVGSERTTHMQMYRDYHGKDELAANQNGRGKYAGRLFLSPKIITFWEFPETKEILYQILTDISEETTINFDNSWRVEVPIIYDKNIDGNGWGSWHPNGGTQKFIPIDKYDGGFTRSKEELRQQHVMPPIEKIKNKNISNNVHGWGSDKTSWDSPDNIRVRQQRMTSESLKK